MTFNHPNKYSAEWQRVRRAEDLLALLTAITDHARVIKVHAYNEANWDQVWQESLAIIHKSNSLHREARQIWKECAEKVGIPTED